MELAIQQERPFIELKRKLTAPLPKRKGDSQFNEPNPKALKCRQDLRNLQRLTPPARRF